MTGAMNDFDEISDYFEDISNKRVEGFDKSCLSSSDWTQKSML